MNSPRICAVITSPDLEIVRQAELLTDLFELRIDLLGASWESVAKAMRMPWIATNRLSSEGGIWKDSEEKRRNELLKAIKLGASVVDIELSSPDLDEIVSQIKKQAKCLISWHDIKHTPPLSELHRLVENEISYGADICKVVTTAHNTEDNLRMLELIKKFPHSQLTAFAMGSYGQLSRVLCPLYGGCFIYASLSEGLESASGQLSLAQMHRLYELVKT